MGIEFNPNEKTSNVKGDNKTPEDEKLLEELKKKKKSESIFNEKNEKVSHSTMQSCGYCDDVC